MEHADENISIARRESQEENRQVLSFHLEDETYAVDLLRVREIRGYSAVTRMPEAPAHMLGVLNLRGSIVPIIDMRRRIGGAAIEPTTQTVVVVLSVEGARGRRDFGLVVDGVSDVLDIPPERIKSPPEVVSAYGEDLVLGLAHVGERMVMLLDIDRMLGVDHCHRSPSEGCNSVDSSAAAPQ